MKHSGSKLFIGAVIVLAGTHIILSAAGISFSLFFRGWWTIPIILIALISLINNGLSSWNFSMLLIGSWLLANQRGWIPSWVNGAYLAGAVVIGFGLIFLINPQKEEQEGREGKRRTASSQEREDTHTNPSYTAIFSGQDIYNSSDQLDGSTLFALFGGLTVDFRDAKIDHDIVIDASAVFGGVDIRFPKHVRVVTRATPLFGGVDNRTHQPKDLQAPVVTVRCLAAFGGIDIR